MLNGQLVISPEANDLFASASVPSGRKLLIGDATKFEGTRSAIAMQRADAALAGSIDKFKDLENDKTRPTPLDKNKAGKEIATKVIAVLNDLQGTLESEAKQYGEEAVDMQAKEFEMSRSSDFVLRASLEWLQKTAKEEGGLAKIREVAKTDKAVARLIFNLQPHLIGVPKDVHSKLWEHCVSHHAPRSLGLLELHKDMMIAVEKCRKTIGKVDRNFYSSLILAQAATRVEV